MPRPGSTRFTEQSRWKGRSRFNRAVNPAPTHKVSAASINMPLALTSRVLPRKTAEPHSISSSARNEKRVARRRSVRRAEGSLVAMDRVKPPARDFVPRRQVGIAAWMGPAYAWFHYKPTTPIANVLLPVFRSHRLEPQKVKIRNQRALHRRSPS